MAKSEQNKQLDELLDYFKKKSFRQDDTRYSNERNPGSIEELSDSLPSLLKNIRKAAKDVTSLIDGGAFRRQHDRYYKAIEDAAEKLESVNRKFGAEIARQYKEAMKLNEGNYKVQQEITDTLKTFAIQSAEIQQRKQEFDAADRKTKRAMLQSINETSSKLRDFNINVERITNLNDKTVNKLNQFSDAVGVIARDSEVFAGELKEHYGEELKVRQAFITATAKAVFDVTNKVFGTTESRLQAFQTQTRFVEAAWRGLSAQEFNEWQQTNRMALTLQGDQTVQDRQYAELSSELKQYGFIGKDTAQQISFLNDTLIRSGANTSAANAKTLQNSIAQLRVMSGMSQEAANAFAAEMLTSPEVMALTFGKNEAERQAIQQDQLTELTKISLRTGFSADYMFQMLKEQRAAKYKDVISKITGDVTLRAAIQEYERLTGRDLTAQQETVLREAQQGVGAPEDAQILLDTRKMIGADIERLVTESSAAIAAGDFGTGTRPIILQELFGRTGASLQEWGTAGMMAEQVAMTRGAAVEQTDVAGEVINAMQSLTGIETAYLSAKELVVGAQSSVVGGIAGSIMQGAGLYLGAKMLDSVVGRFGGGSGKGGMFKGLFSKISGAFGGAAAGAADAGPAKPGRARGKLGLLAATAGILGAGTFMSGTANASEAAITQPQTPAAGQGGIDWASLGLFAGIEGIAQRRNIMSFAKSGNMLGQARGMMTLGNAGALGKGLLKRVGPIGALFGAHQGFNTDTNDYRTMFGMDIPKAGEYSIAGDLGVRTLGVLNDVISESTFGLIDFANREALAMTSGGTIDENGNVIPPGQDATVEALNQIAENTSRTVEVIDETNKNAMYMDEKRRTESQFASAARRHVEAVMSNHATLQSSSTQQFNAAFDASNALFVS